MASGLPYDFYSKENMKLLIDICHDYMREKHNIDISQLTDIKSHKRLVYDTMNEIYEKNRDLPHSQLNVFVLTFLKEHYVRRAEEIKITRKPNTSLLTREADLYGDRPLSMNVPPEASKKVGINEPLQRPLDRLISERELDYKNDVTRPDISKLGKQIKELPEESGNFMKKLDMLQAERDAIFIENNSVVMTRMADDNAVQQINDVINHDPKALFASMAEANSAAKLKQLEYEKNLFNQPIDTSQTYINPRVRSTTIVKKYLSINSIDRDWSLEPLRFRYSINSMGSTNDFQSRYRNIQELSVGRVVIPEEVIDKTGLSNLNSIKTVYNYDFNFAYPYLILQIDEITDVYDGTNDDVRRGFCNLIYEQSYRAPNGRGYIILKPMQKEKKVFYPAPLTSFSRLSISLLRPNGALVNDSSDNYKLFKVEYEQFNVQYLKIVTNVYFDKNEFYIGDEVVIKNHVMIANEAGMSDVFIRRFNEFINRRQGHEIKQIGSANDDGFFRSFYIQAPGVFDKVQGKFIIDDDVINTLNTYNGQINFCDPTIGTNGILLNMSLQNTIGLKMGLVVDDAHNFVVNEPL